MQTVYDLDDPVEPLERRRWPFVVFGIVLAILVVGGIAGAWINGRVNPSGPPGTEIRVTVTPGMSTSDIAKLLQRDHVVRNATVFTWYARITGSSSSKAGDYVFHHNQHLSEVVKILQRGGTAESDRVTIPEGLTLAEVAQRVGQLPGRSADAFLAAAKDGTIRSQFEPPDSNNLEGLLLPDTYFVDRQDSEAKILTRMVAAFDSYANQIGLPAAAARLGLTPYQVITTASLVEREARVDDDRAPIARVIYNRLAANRKLQIDATVQYALGQQKARLTIADTKIDSPYNTYQITGLPPGPIASPSRKSLDASLDPPPGPWLYYVLADANGKHAFATTDAEFAKLKAEAQKKGLL